MNVATITCFSAVMISSATAQGADPAIEPNAAPIGLYDLNPEHLWNRLHRTFFTWAGADASPLHWPHRDYSMSSRQGIEVLEEFLRTNGENLIEDPLQRALLQHDLSLVFECSADRRELQTQLLKVMKRLALSRDQIRALPDNYAAAVAAKKYSAEFDPANPSKPFLPPDLWQPDGPWVLLGNGTSPVAISHLEFFGGRSLFFVFMRLPGGRSETIEYVRKLKDDRAPPQFPAGTQVALARQAMLIDEQGELQPTKLTESMQLRVDREPNRAMSQAQGTTPKPQYAYEFKLLRKELLSGIHGGLHPAAREDREWAFILYMGNNAGDGQEPILFSCFQCHGRPGIQSVNSYSRFFPPKIVPRLHDSTREAEAATIIRWNKQRYNWALLRRLWPNG